MRASRWALAAAVALLALPWLPLLLRSVTDAWPFPSLVGQGWSWRGWLTVDDGGGSVLVGAALSGFIAACVSVVACVVAWPAARVLGLHRFRGRRVVMAVLLLPVVVPPLASAMGLQVLFISAGLSGSVVGVIAAHLIPALPYALALLTSGFANLDPSYEAQASVLGASRWRRTWSVTLPLMRAPLAAAAVMAFLVSWNDVVLTLLIGAGQVSTLPQQLYAATGATDVAAAAAVAVAAAGPPVVLVWLMSRPLAQASRANVGAR